MQYCFMYSLPAQFADEAPFVVSETSDDEVKFCWRGPRLPTHAAGCVGCDCAQWTLHVNGDVMTSVFMMSPPAIHAQMNLKRIGHPPAPEAVRDGWDCQFDNHTGHPKETKNVHSDMVGFLQKSHGASMPTDLQSASMGNRQCVKINEMHDVRLRYEATTMPCWPCDVKFTISTTDSGMAGRYLAIGFKGFNAAYAEKGDYKIMSGGLGEKPDYWGMSTDAVSHNQTDLAGRILLGHVSDVGVGCVRHMQAREFVGAPIDVKDDGFVRDVVMERSRGRISLTFIAKIHAANMSSDLDWKRGSFGRWRVMWATGQVGGGSACDAQPQFHGPTRALANLGFPGWGQSCDEEVMDSQMLDSDADAPDAIVLV